MIYIITRLIVLIYLTNDIPVDCNQALGMEDRTIADDKITASTIFNEHHAASQGRLNNNPSGKYIGAWIPAEG